MKTFQLRLLAFVFGAFILFAAGSSAVQAQTACLPDCFNDDFTPKGFLDPIDLEVPGQPGCFLRVTYGYRLACGIWHDFYIYDIEVIGECNGSFLADINAVVQTATTLLFMSNPPVDKVGTTVGPPKPACGEVACVTNWRVIQGACWQFGVNEKYFACEQTTCCLQPYQICRDFCDNITVTSFGGFGGNCESSGPGCVPVCN
ncbi:MAG: hypothetical protein AAGN35_23145 [Bacteroidota bacterium]